VVERSETRDQPVGRVRERREEVVRPQKKRFPTTTETTTPASRSPAVRSKRRSVRGSAAAPLRQRASPRQPAPRGQPAAREREQRTERSGDDPARCEVPQRVPVRAERQFERVLLAVSEDSALPEPGPSIGANASYGKVRGEPVSRKLYARVTPTKTVPNSAVNPWRRTVREERVTESPPPGPRQRPEPPRGG